MGISAEDVRRMAPWAQEQIAQQMMQKRRGVPECFVVRKDNPSVLPAASHLPLHKGGFSPVGKCYAINIEAEKTAFGGMNTKIPPPS
jgi:hypothetical protein